MVIFNVPQASDASNEQMSLHSSSTSSGDPKKRYRMTPHPSSKPPRDSERGPGATSDISNIDACFSNIPSPETERANNSTEIEMQPEHSEDSSGMDAAESEWAEWVESCEDGKQNAIPNLKAYMLAKEARDDAKKAFENALEECLQTMTQAMTEELLADTVGVVYQEQGERFEAYESTIIGTIKSNHGRRQHFMHQMEQANANWGRQYKAVQASIWNGRGEKAPALAAGPDDRSDFAVDNDYQKTCASPTSESPGDPNWDQICDYEPASDNARDFLAAREKLRDADDALSHALDEIHSGLKGDADAVAQVVLDFYTEHENESLTLQQDIQYHIMKNCQRRDALEESLQESAKQTQGIIANLLSRLSSGQQRH